MCHLSNMVEAVLCHGHLASNGSGSLVLIHAATATSTTVKSSSMEFEAYKAALMFKSKR